VIQANAGTAHRVTVTARHKGFKAEMGGLRAQLRGLGVGYEIGAAVGRRDRMQGQACRLPFGHPSEQAAARFNAPQAAGMLGARLVIGVDGDLRAWVRVANALLDRIASGAVRAGSRVPPVTGLGLESPVRPGTVARAFRVLAEEGVLCWVPGRGYYVRTRFTVAVSDRPRLDGGLTAMMPGGGSRHA
jgi:Bacterial regulatory proteins, gntR family